MPRVTVIDGDHPQHILLWDGAAVRAVPSDPYHRLKYGHFDGNRIFHAFGGDKRLRIEETYNDGVFNAYACASALDGGGADGNDNGNADGDECRVVQICDAIPVANAVLADDAGAYLKLFGEWYGKVVQSEVVDLLIASGNAERVRAEAPQESDDAAAAAAADEKTDRPRSAYVIDGRFMVDRHGSAYYRGPGGEWKYLCLVVDDSKSEPMKVDMPGHGTVELTSVTRAVVAKIAFLLHPAQDSVFLMQLPEDMRRQVQRMIADRDAYA